MPTLTLAGQKGGTGKSTIAIGLAAELHRRGHRVLLVDADPQGTALTWGDVAAELGYGTPTLIAMGGTMHKKDQLPKLREAFEYTIIDTPGRDGKAQRSALMISDLALLPCGPSAADAWAMAGTVEVIEEARMINPDLEARAIITRRQRRTAIGQQAHETLSSLGIHVMSAALEFRVAYQEFLAAGQGLVDYAPRDRASKELAALTDEIVSVLNQHASVRVA